MKKQSVKKRITQHELRQHNIKEIIELEKRDRISMTRTDRLASQITAFSGSMLYVGLHVIWFVGWILINGGLLGLKPFDPFPFSFLTMVVSLEAIFLASFVLISQNKQALQADKRAKIDLQVNMIAEQENTKLIAMIAEIHQHLGIHTKKDAEVQALMKETSISALADAIDKADVKDEGKKPKGPQSAADTSR